MLRPLVFEPMSSRLRHRVPTQKLARLRSDVEKRLGTSLLKPGKTGTLALGTIPTT